MYYGPERKNQRLKNYDYSCAGYYFVTFCTKNRTNHFGEIVDGEVILNDYGKIVQEGIIKTQKIRDEVEFDECVIMPNHIHMIIIIKDTEHKNPVGNTGMRSVESLHSVGLSCHKSGPHTCGPYENEILNKTKNILSNCIQGLKAYITKEIRQDYGDYEFAWQKSFFDIIIRNEEQLEKTREYIILNPSKWEEDVNNPINIFQI